VVHAGGGMVSHAVLLGGMADFVKNLAIETWALWTLGMLLVACRM
jgi:hypothetical protein